MTIINFLNKFPNFNDYITNLKNTYVCLTRGIIYVAIRRYSYKYNLQLNNYELIKLTNDYIYRNKLEILTFDLI